MSLEAFVNGKKRPTREGNEANVRLELKLDNPTDEKTNEYSYAQLLRNEHPLASPKVKEDPLDPLEDRGEQAKLEAIARKYEEKYGSQKKTRDQDLVDIGGGYDSNDSFVDDSEFYEDYVPPTVDTMYGGFYINTGDLEFVRTKDDNEEMETTPSKAKPVKPKVKKQGSLCTPKAILANKKLKRAKQQIATSAQRTSDMKKKLSNFQSNPKSLLSDLHKAVPQPDVLPVPSEVNPEGPSTSESELTVPELPADLPPLILTKVQQLIESIDRDQSADGKLTYKAKTGYDSMLVDIYSDCKDLKIKTKMGVVGHLAYKLGINRSSLSNRIKRIMKKQETNIDTLIQQLKEAIESVMPSQLDKYNAELKQYESEKVQSGHPPDDNVDDESVADDPPLEATLTAAESNKTRKPKKSFKWTPEIKSLVNEVVASKVKAESINKTKGQAGEELITKFLDTQIKPLWPKGWMQRRTLYKLTEPVHSKLTNTTQPTKKLTAVKEKSTNVSTAVVKKEPAEEDSIQLSLASVFSSPKPSTPVTPLTPTSKIPPISTYSPSTITSVPNPALSKTLPMAPLPTAPTYSTPPNPKGSQAATSSTSFTFPAQKNLHSTLKPMVASQPQGMKTSPVSVIHGSTSIPSPAPAAFQPEARPINPIFKKKPSSKGKGSLLVAPPKASSAGKVTKPQAATQIFQGLPKEQLEAFLRGLSSGNQQVQLIVPNNSPAALSLIAKSVPKPSLGTPPSHGIINPMIHHTPPQVSSSPYQSFPRAFSPALSDHCYTSTPSQPPNPLSLHPRLPYTISTTTPVASSTYQTHFNFSPQKKS